MNKTTSALVIGTLLFSVTAAAQTGNANSNKNSREVASALNGLANAELSAAQAPSITVGTFNIGAAKVSSISEIAKAIKASKVDIMALQEVDQLTQRSGNIDHLAELKKLTGMYGIYGAAIDYDGGKYGLAFLSKYPITQKRLCNYHPVIASSGSRLSQKLRHPTSLPLSWQSIPIWIPKKTRRCVSSKSKS